MGQWDIPIIGGVVLIGGYFVITNPDLFANLFPQPEPEPEPNGNGGEVEEGNGNGNGNGNGKSGGSSKDCKKYCSNCWCKSYKDKKCSAGCSGCKGGNRVGKCAPSGGGGGSSSGGDGDYNCGKACLNGWCDSFRSKCRNHPGGCAKCNVGGSGGKTNCPDLCRRRECSTYRSKCGSGCTQCNCKHLCSTAQCGTYKKAGCSKSSCPSCAYAFHTYGYSYPAYEEMRLTVV